MKKTLKNSFLLFIVFAIFSALTLTASAKTDEASTFAISCLFGHDVVATPAVDATCTTNGSYGGTYCSKCGTVLAESTIVPAKGHTQSEIPTLKPATTELDGEYGYACVGCNMTMDGRTIPKIDSKSVTLSTTECVYNGKVRTPSIKIKDIQGKLLVENQDYTITYASGRKNPGKYIVTVTFIGNYEGISKLTFTILPKAVSDLKATAQTSSSIALSWSKVTGATGYQVYKYNSSTKKYEKVKSLTANSYDVTGLKGNTSYKFKVRAYKKTADGTIYGDYSSVCTAKTKVAYGVTFTGSSATIYAGETKQLKATTTPADKKLTWKSSDTSVAKVSSTGKVTAMKNGTVTITASFKYKDKTYKATYKITVVKPSIKLSETSVGINKGEILEITATTDPAYLTVIWKSSNTSVATVSSGLVTAKKAGTTTITASITYKGKTYVNTCKVTVKSASENIEFLIDFIKTNGKINPGGHKYITLSNYDPGYDKNSVFHIFYLEYKDCLEFVLYDFDSTSEWISIAAHLDRSGTYMDYSGNVDSDFNNPPSRDPFTTYSLKVVGTINPSEYVSAYSPQKFLVENTYPSNQQSYANSLLYRYTDKAMEGWDYFLFKVVGLRLKDLGFTNYH